jgi:hypothetical protein
MTIHTTHPAAQNVLAAADKSERGVVAPVRGTSPVIQASNGWTNIQSPVSQTERSPARTGQTRPARGRRGVVLRPNRGLTRIFPGPAACRVPMLGPRCGLKMASLVARCDGRARSEVAAGCGLAAHSPRSLPGWHRPSASPSAWSPIFRRTPSRTPSRFPRSPRIVLTVAPPTDVLSTATPILPPPCAWSPRRASPTARPHRAIRAAAALRGAQGAPRRRRASARVAAPVPVPRSAPRTPARSAVRARRATAARQKHLLQISPRLPPT